MISCAVIQKLERYGQLGLKRHTVVDFIQSSLKDPKRGTVYALTHIPTWAECLAALTQDNDTDSAPFSSGPLHVNDSLLYAVSFATAFVAHHMDTQRTHCVSLPDADVAPLFPTPLADAAALLSLLRRVTESCAARNRRGGNNNNSPALLGALNHLLSTALDTLLTATVLRYSEDKAEQCSSISSSSGSSRSSSSEAARLRRELCQSATGLLAATASQLRSAQARPLSAAAAAGDHSSAPKAFTTRTCPAQLHQLLSRARQAKAQLAEPEHTRRNEKGKEQKDKGNKGNKEEASVPAEAAADESHALVTARLVAWAAAAAPRPGTLLSALVPLSLFQKISLLDTLVAEAPSICCGVAVERFRRSLALLVAPSAGNRATRVVVYFRGDEIKLMQNNVRDAVEYALHTHVTTPPVEDATLRGIAELDSPPLQQFGALLLAQWMSSISFFFRSFCAEESWTAFAQEQRRMVLRQESSARRERRQQKRYGMATRDSVSNCSDSNKNNNNNHHNSRNGNEHMEDQHSVASQMSGLSMASRASMLSAMSKASAVSYQSFMSLIDAARGANSADGNNEETTTPAMHQSVDGNTNLPLILLEEVTLGLKRFLTAAEKNGVDTLIDVLGLRALAWRTIGDLYAFVQYTMTAPGNALNADVDNPMYEKEQGITTTQSVRNPALDKRASITPVFHLGHDIRYNRGMGYEVLGLLFANVVLPQLQAERSITQSQTNRRDIETALTRCLAAYEVIAPQVIDQNVPDILRVAAHVAVNPVVQQQQQKKDGRRHAFSLKSDGTSDDTTMLHRFLMSLLTRLGKGNQIPMLLDAVVTLVKSTSQPNKETRRRHMSKSHNEAEEEEEEEKEEEENEITIAGLHAIFAHPCVRSALVEACAVSLDPEALTARLVACLSPWASEELATSDPQAEVTETADGAQEDLCATHPSRLRPSGGLFVLDLVATVLEGISPTCLTASALLEQAAEVELTLSTFLVNRLYVNFFAESNEEEEDVSSPLRDTSKGTPQVFAGGKISSKMQRHFMLCTLHAIYQSRELVLSCLQDLGIQNVEAYLRMLEETLWQVESRVGALVGSLSIDDLHGTMSLTTQQHYAPFVHRATLLPRLALQRLRLARSVGATLDISIGPKKEARRLAAFVLCHMHPMNEDGIYPSSEEGIARALELVNHLTEDHWHCLLQFGKHQRLRRTLVCLLRVSFTTTSANKAHATDWLPRCLRTCAGFVLEALHDIVVSVPDADVCAANRVSLPTAPHEVAQSTESTNAKESDDDQQAPLVQLCAALSDALKYLGHIPQWPFLLQRCVHWLLLLQAHSGNAHHIMNEKEKIESTPLSLLERRLVQLTMTFLSCEDAVHGVLRRALLEQSKPNREKESHPMANEDSEKKSPDGMPKRVAKNQSERGRNEVNSNNVFFEVIGVPPITSIALCSRDAASANGTEHKHEDEEVNHINDEIENDDDDDNDDNDPQQEQELEQHKAMGASAISAQMAAHIFSPDFAALLVRHCSIVASENVAAHVLQKLYSIALLAAQQINCRSARATAHEEQKGNNIATGFLHSIVMQLRRRCDAEDFTAIAAFLDTVGPTGTISFFTRPAQPNPKQEQKRGRRDANAKGASALPLTCEEEEKEFGAARIPELSLQWMRLLAAMLPQVIRCISTMQCKSIPCVENEDMDESKGQSAKMHHQNNSNNNNNDKKKKKTNKDQKEKDELLLHAFAALYILLERHRLRVPQAFSGKRRRDTDEKEFHNEKADQYTMSLAARGVAMCDESLVEYMGQLFAPGDVSSRGLSAATISYLISYSSASLRTLWVLRSIYECHSRNDTHQHQHQRQKQKEKNNNNNNNCSDEANWFDAVLLCYNPDEHSVGTSTALASAASNFLLRRGKVPRLSLPDSAATTRWIIAQLQATPDLIRAFPSSVSLHQHMRRILREAIVLNPINNNNNNNNNNEEEEEEKKSTHGTAFWMRQRELLRACAVALGELSTVPSLTFGSWRGDVKRLLIASGSLHLHTSSAYPDATRDRCDALFVDVLELCALPLVTLHEDSSFIDHELSFLQGLFMSREICGQAVMLRLLQLLTRTLLPLGVLWRRVHMMPGLLAALSTKCLEGVSRGKYSRVVLNQLSSFLFQFVRDAESAPAWADIPAPVRSLCMASVTSCLFRLAAPLVNVFTTHSSDVDFLAADLLKALQRVHLPKRRALSAIQQNKTEGALGGSEKGSGGGIVWSDATMCDLSYACVGDSDSQSLLRLAAERVEEEDGNAARHIFMVPQ